MPRAGSARGGDVLTLPSAVRIYVAAEAVDLRRGFDGLAAATRSLIRQDPLFCGGPRYVTGGAGEGPVPGGAAKIKPFDTPHMITCLREFGGPNPSA